MGLQGVFGLRKVDLDFRLLWFQFVDSVDRINRPEIVTKTKPCKICDIPFLVCNGNVLIAFKF